jgi:hypothetical protein
MTLTARARKQRFLRSSDFESLSRYEPHPRSRISALSLRFAPRGSKKRAYRYESSVWAPFASCLLNVLPSGRTRTIHERKSSNLEPHKFESETRIRIARFVPAAATAQTSAFPANLARVGYALDAISRTPKKLWLLLEVLGCPWSIEGQKVA